MASQKKLKYPKKPKAGASVKVMENYLRKRKEVEKKNKQREAEAKKKAALRTKISRLTS